MLNEFGIDIWLFTNEKWLTRNGDGEYVPHEQRAIRADPTVVGDFSPFMSSACKVVGSSADPALLQRCEAAMLEAVGTQATAVRSQSYYLDVTPPGHDKGTFVQAMARRLRIPTDRDRHHRRHAERSRDVSQERPCRSRWATPPTTSSNRRRMSRPRTMTKALQAAIEMILRNNAAG